MLNDCKHPTGAWKCHAVPNTERNQNGCSSLLTSSENNSGEMSDTIGVKKGISDFQENNGEPSLAS